MVDTDDAWIVERTGIRERRIVEPGTGASVHGALAARQALEHAGVTAAEIDLIIVPTVTPDMMFPATACIIQHEIGAVNAWGFDLEGACSGFLFALQNARAQVEAGHARRVLVVGTEIMSSITNYEDRNSCILFGDGAGAINRVDGVGIRFLHQKAGGSVMPASAETVANKLHTVYQEGRDVYKFAVKGMAGVTAEIVERNGLTGADVDLFVPHQANIRIIEAAQQRLGLPDSKVMITIDRFGNTTSASIPSALRVACDEGRLREGHNVVLCAFGAGFTWGACLLRWAAR
jgi:3-oxoacyl-[acyl-carrier-protein] synthase-3